MTNEPTKFGMSQPPRNGPRGRFNASTLPGREIPALEVSAAMGLAQQFCIMAFVASGDGDLPLVYQRTHQTELFFAVNQPMNSIFSNVRPQKSLAVLQSL